ncbi:hypothetical protein [Streptomyces sp. NPDC048410]|uniref:hypothetical protein n=1 Tax=Streptomyces sp. NPDC048410 TaxID=3365545 RepID=UPI00371BFF96
MAQAWDMTTEGQGSTSRHDTAGGQDPAASAARNHAAQRRQQMAESLRPTHNDLMAEHYAEKAAVREVERREAESYRHSVAWSRDREALHEIEFRFVADDPEPYVPPADADDFSERMTEWSDWTERKAQYATRAEGEELAARIFNRWR